jgi:nitrate/TMAO reductase-like tetraheme cytochrome c subunit
MYSADKIDSFCQGCHNSHNVPPGKVVARWATRNPDKTDPDKIVCTDCHGDHRMKVRTIIWDKKTGKLLSTNRGK